MNFVCLIKQKILIPFTNPLGIFSKRNVEMKNFGLIALANNFDEIVAGTGEFGEKTPFWRIIIQETDVAVFFLQCGIDFDNGTVGAHKSEGGTSDCFS